MRKDLIERSIKASAKDRKTYLPNKIIKLGEEVGEVQSAYLAYAGAPNASKSESGTYENLVEETIDVILVAYDILQKLDAPEDLVNEITEKKITKWESKLK